VRGESRVIDSGLADLYVEAASLYDPVIGFEDE
jgi:hypothetical protein